MKPIDVIILVVAVLIVGGVIALSVIRKKQGKSVGCDCSSCSGNCSCCNAAKKQNED